MRDFFNDDPVRIPGVSHPRSRSTGGGQPCGTVPRRCPRAMSGHGHGRRREGEASAQTIAESSGRQREHEQVQSYVRHGQCLDQSDDQLNFIVIHLQDSRLVTTLITSIHQFLYDFVSYYEFIICISG